MALYGFADASGKGFSSMLVVGGLLMYHHGQWATSIEEESSNYRDLFNLVLAINKEAYKMGALNNSELCMFTNNTMAEAAFYKGTSSSQVLFDLVLQLRKVQMDGKISMHMIHISGTWMIEEGTDGLSHGSLAEGVMGGAEILSYAPLHLSAMEWSSSLKGWV